MFIGSIPRFLQCFFKPLRRHFQDYQWDYVAPLLIVWATMTRPRKLCHLAAAWPHRSDRTCLADSYYCCAEVLKAAEEREFGFPAPAKMNCRLDLGRRGQG